MQICLDKLKKPRNTKILAMENRVSRGMPVIDFTGKKKYLPDVGFPCCKYCCCRKRNCCSSSAVISISLLFVDFRTMGFAITSVKYWSGLMECIFSYKMATFFSLSQPAGLKK